MLFQVFTTYNDKNGNPRRLIYVYNDTGIVIEKYLPDYTYNQIVSKLRNRGLSQLPSIFIGRSEFNLLRKIENAPLDKIPK